MVAKMCPLCGIRPKPPGKGQKYCDECPRKSGDLKYRARQRQAANHGLTMEQLEAMKTKQGHRCAICGIAEMILVVDHDHSCCPGKFSCGECIRGLICNHCNVGLGMFKDDPSLLLSAINYLEEQ